MDVSAGYSCRNGALVTIRGQPSHVTIVTHRAINGPGDVRLFMLCALKHYDLWSDPTCLH